jgi:hypothetical protein
MNNTPTNSQSFRPVLELAGLLSGFKELWFVAGGWAIDLYVQEGRRKHKDVDIAVFRQDQLLLQQYFLTKGWKLWKYVGDSEVLEPWLPGEKLELPDRGVYALPVNTAIRSVDILLSERKGAQWWFHRDTRITHPIKTVGICLDLDIPFLSPEIVLLFKAHHLYTDDSSSLRHRQIDEADFQAVHKLMTTERRTWLKQAIALLYPNHPWLKYLR